jgi:glutathione S-transferase
MFLVKDLMAMLNYTAIVTLLAILFYFYTSLAVGQARVKYGVHAPAISGHPEFERLFRIQMNTMEWMPIFLPSLWLFALYVNDLAAASIGLLWVLARILYFRGYAAAAEKRHTGFGIQALAAALLYIGAFAGIVMKMLPSA